MVKLSGADGADDAADKQDLLAAKMTPVQIAEAQRLAYEWRASSALPQWANDQITSVVR